MAWHIDRDYLAEGGSESRVGHEEEHERIPLVLAVALGVESGELPSRDAQGNGLPHVRFRLLDDDGEVYYGGWLHDDDECENQLAVLRYGESDAGCTTVEVKRGDKWVQEVS